MRQVVTVKFGSDLVVTEEGLNSELLNYFAQQAFALNAMNTDLVVVTSGAVKYGRILGKAEGATELSKEEAAYKGFDSLMENWKETFAGVGLLAIALTLTGQSLTEENFREIETQINNRDAGTSFVANTHDGLNSKEHEYYQAAANNDIVGERLAELCSDTYIICTNVDGVIDKNGQIITDFQDMDQLNDITFYEESKNGTGGMKTKMQAAIQFAKSREGRAAHIVNGNEQDVVLKVLRGEKVGTKVQFRRKE